MKVVNLGNNAVAIEPDTAEDRISSAPVFKREEHNVSSEAIEIYRKYLQATKRRADAIGRAGDRER